MTNKYMSWFVYDVTFIGWKSSSQTNWTNHKTKMPKQQHLSRIIIIVFKETKSYKEIKGGNHVNSRLWFFTASKVDLYKPYKIAWVMYIHCMYHQKRKWKSKDTSICIYYQHKDTIVQKCKWYFVWHVSSIHKKDFQVIFW
jgi:hypothetical protein